MSSSKRKLKMPISERELKISSKKAKRILQKQNEMAASELQELSKVLSAAVPPDPEEEALASFVLGGDAETFEEAVKSASDEETVPEYSEEVKKPAWIDEDDENILIKDKIKNYDNCLKSVSLRSEEKFLPFAEEKFIKLMGNPEWANTDKSKEDSSDDESADELLQKTGKFIEPSKTLPRGIINIKKCPTLFDENLKESRIMSVEFHQVSRVALMAGTNGVTSLFQIDGKTNAKIQSVYFENFPVHTAHFSVDGREIVAGSNKFGHYFAYDMFSGKVTRIKWEKGMEQFDVRKFHMSPDGKLIVIHGRYGNMHLVNATTKEWISTLKMNGDVVAIAFNRDGSRMYSHGVGGEVYIWDMARRACIHKFTDQGCLTGTSLTLSPNDQFLASGSDCGVVNIYDNASLLSTSEPQPLKALMNLTTEVTNLKFNCTSELLAMASSRKGDAVKLIHFPSMTAFSNFPVIKSDKSMRINSLDISVNSGYLCLGNKCNGNIFRLKHYDSY